MPLIEQRLNWFTKFNIQIGQYLLYLYLTVLTVVVIVQIDRLQDANNAMKSILAMHQREAGADVRELRLHDEMQTTLLHALETDMTRMYKEQTDLIVRPNKLSKRGHCDEDE